MLRRREGEWGREGLMKKGEREESWSKEKRTGGDGVDGGGGR